MTLKLSPRMRPRTKSDLVSAPERWNKSIALYWSLGLGSRTCQLSQHGLSGAFSTLPFSVCLSTVVFFFNYDFGVIIPSHRGKGLCGTNSGLCYKDTPYQYQELIRLKYPPFWGVCFGVLPPCVILACKVTASFQISHYQWYSLFFLAFPCTHR